MRRREGADRRPLVQDTRSLSSQASLLAELQGEVGKSKDTREKLRLLLREEVDKKWVPLPVSACLWFSGGLPHVSV